VLEGDEGDELLRLGCIPEVAVLLAVTTPARMNMVPVRM